ncbi:Flp family type IVb pilin [bacterium]|nr:MAG: Flp family type IVb pilin [bacterium]
MLRDDQGQGLVEYALILAFVAMVAVAALTAIGAKTNDELQGAANGLQ